MTGSEDAAGRVFYGGGGITPTSTSNLFLFSVRNRMPRRPSVYPQLAAGRPGSKDTKWKRFRTDETPVDDYAITTSRRRFRNFVRTARCRNYCRATDAEWICKVAPARGIARSVSNDAGARVLLDSDRSLARTSSSPRGQALAESARIGALQGNSVTKNDPRKTTKQREPKSLFLPFV